DRETDFATTLRNNGYRTALIGKDHCFGNQRLQTAFEHTYIASHLGYANPQTETENRVNEVRKPTMQMPFADDPVPPDQNITASLFDAARHYVDTSADNPFFLWLSIPDPHPPYMVCEPYASMYDDTKIPAPIWEAGEMDNKPFRQRQVVNWNAYDREYPGDDIDKLRRIYWGMVSCIDTEMGKLIDHINTTGMADNTIVIFTSDHGDYMGDHHMIRKGPHVYEALSHVSFIASWPGHFPAKSTDAMIANIDIFPTLFDLIGIDVPDGVQGQSFASVLTGQSDHHRDCIFLEHGTPGPALQPDELSSQKEQKLGAGVHHLCPEINKGRTKGVRSDRWKYVTTEGDVDELYDLENDPHEIHNLADDPEHKDVVHEHQRYMLDWLVETEDTLEE
ncbi:MAG: sulfatase-like hydrolase/transferase, partial [Candidatus Latescibacteria bacterium]|nr:sulfatase-like hydrolase/transferase [Candidatus Latescibacterota bacterium]